MFYHEKTNNGLFIWNDYTKGKYGPFLSIYSKNNWYGKIDLSFDISEYPGYKYSLGFTEKKVFILDGKGSIEIKNIS